MTDAEINAKCLQIIDWVPVKICICASCDNCLKECVAPKDCEYRLPGQTAFCKLTKVEPAPDFFASKANPMPLIEWCEKNEIAWQVGHWVRDKNCVASLRVWGKKHKEGEAEGEHLFPVAAFALAIFELEARK